MQNQPGKLQFQFTRDEVLAADLARFNLVFGLLAQEADYGARPEMCGLCGAVSLSFDPDMAREGSAPLGHPGFSAFAKKLIETMPSLGFFLGLRDNTLMFLVMGSLSTADPASTEFPDRVELLVNTAIRWCEAADMRYDECVARGAEVQAYMDRAKRIPLA